MRKVLFFCLVSVLIFNGNSQSADSLRKIKLGFDIGGNYTFLQIEKAGQSNQNQITTLNGLGFRIGIVMDYKINRHFSLIPKAELSFNDVRLYTVYGGGSKESRSISPLTVEISPHFAFKLSDKKVKPYFLIGPVLKIPIPDASNPRALEINSNVVGVDLGFGLNRALKYFNFSPELRYSYGLNNISNSADISKMYFHNVSLVFIFKG